MGSGSSRGRVSTYQSLPEETEAYRHPASGFDKPAGKSPKRASSSPDADESAVNATEAVPDPPASPVRVRAGGRKSKASDGREDAFMPPGVISDGPISRKAPRVISGSNPGPQVLAGQAPAIPQPQPLHQRRVQQPAQEPALPLQNRQHHEEQFVRCEDRKAQEEAAMAAIRAALPQPKQRPAPAYREELTAKGADKKPSNPFMDIAADRAGRAREKQSKTRFPEVSVSIAHRKVLLHWVKLSRKRVNARQAQAAGQQRSRRKKRKPVRVDKLVELYLENQEELEQLCFEDPEQIIYTQIELLTQRIDELDDEVAAEKRRAEAEAIGRRRGADNKDDKGTLSIAAKAAATKREARERMMQQQMWDWETAFDSAVEKREAWKKSRGDREREAQEKWRHKVVATWPAPMPAKEAQKIGKSDVVEKMKVERDRLKDILSNFEAQQRRQKYVEEQPALDLAEALREEQRAAMAERARELREQRQHEAEAKRRQQEEAEERRRQAEEAERQRQRLREEEERRRKEREAEEAERRRREDEERELERLRKEKKESERKRVEERRLAEEREKARRKEIEERRRLEEERLAAERRARLEKEERQRKREEEEHLRAEQERRRIEEERRAEEDAKQRRAIARAVLMESVFDDLEEACEDEEEEEDQEPVEEIRHTLEKEMPPARSPAAPTLATQDAEEETQKEEVEEKRTVSRSGDWMSRALGALHEGEDSDSESEDGDEEHDGESPEGAMSSPLSDEERLAADVQLLKLTGALAKKIDQIHGD